MSDRPNVAKLKLISVTMPRLRNCRRDTPSVSGSGGTHGVSSPELALTISFDGSRRSMAAAFSTSRPGDGRRADHRALARSLCLDARLAAEAADGLAGVAPTGRAREQHDREHDEHADARFR